MGAGVVKQSRSANDARQDKRQQQEQQLQQHQQQDDVDGADGGGLTSPVVANDASACSRDVGDGVTASKGAGLSRHSSSDKALSSLVSQSQTEAPSRAHTTPDTRPKDEERVTSRRHLPGSSRSSSSYSLKRKSKTRSAIFASDAEIEGDKMLTAWRLSRDRVRVTITGVPEEDMPPAVHSPTDSIHKCSSLNQLVESATSSFMSHLHAPSGGYDSFPARPLSQVMPDDVTNSGFTSDRSVTMHPDKAAKGEKRHPLRRSKGSLKETGSRPLDGSHHVSLGAEVLYGSGGKTLEASVVQVQGSQTRKRHLTLTSDQLIIQKSRPSGHSPHADKHATYHTLTDLWVAESVDAVTSESVQWPERSLVVGWPVTSVVFTFESVELRFHWYRALYDRIERKREDEGIDQASVSVQLGEQTTTVSQLNVSAWDNSHDLLRHWLTANGGRESDVSDYQLYVQWDKNWAPLVGHESPFAIAVKHARLANMDNLVNNTPVSDEPIRFLVKPVRQALATPVKAKADDKNRQKLRHLLPFFRNRSQHGPHGTSATKSSRSDAAAAAMSAQQTEPTGVLFGRRLEDICDDDGQPPKPLKNLLQFLVSTGPGTHGIFRKNAGGQQCKDIRQQMDLGLDGNFTSPHVASSILKDFLRSMPECLLTDAAFSHFLALADISDGAVRLNKIKELVEHLPACHLSLATHIFCMLHLVSLSADINQMTAANLGVCIGQSLLWSHSDKSPTITAVQVPIVVQHLVANCTAVFDRDSVSDLLDAAEDQQEQQQLPLSPHLLTPPIIDTKVSNVDSDNCSSTGSTSYQRPFVSSWESLDFDSGTDIVRTVSQDPLSDSVTDLHQVTSREQQLSSSDLDVTGHTDDVACDDETSSLLLSAASSLSTSVFLSHSPMSAERSGKDVNLAATITKQQASPPSFSTSFDVAMLRNAAAAASSSSSASSSPSALQAPPRRRHSSMPWSSEVKDTSQHQQQITSDASAFFVAESEARKKQFLTSLPRRNSAEMLDSTATDDRAQQADYAVVRNTPTTAASNNTAMLDYGTSPSMLLLQTAADSDVKRNTSSPATSGDSSARDAVDSGIVESEEDDIVVMAGRNGPPVVQETAAPVVVMRTKHTSLVEQQSGDSGFGSAQERQSDIDTIGSVSPQLTPDVYSPMTKDVLSSVAFGDRLSSGSYSNSYVGSLGADFNEAAVPVIMDTRSNRQQQQVTGNAEMLATSPAADGSRRVILRKGMNFTGADIFPSKLKRLSHAGTDSAASSPGPVRAMACDSQSLRVGHAAAAMATSAGDICTTDKQQQQLFAGTDADESLTAARATSKPVIGSATVPPPYEHAVQYSRMTASSSDNESGNVTAATARSRRTSSGATLVSSTTDSSLASTLTAATSSNSISSSKMSEQQLLSTSLPDYSEACQRAAMLKGQRSKSVHSSPINVQGQGQDRGFLTTSSSDDSNDNTPNSTIMKHVNSSSSSSAVRRSHSDVNSRMQLANQNNSITNDVSANKSAMNTMTVSQQSRVPIGQSPKNLIGSPPNGKNSIGLQTAADSPVAVSVTTTTDVSEQTDNLKPIINEPIADETEKPSVPSVGLKTTLATTTVTSNGATAANSQAKTEFSLHSRAWHKELAEEYNAPVVMRRPVIQQPARTTSSRGTASTYGQTPSVAAAAVNLASRHSFVGDTRAAATTAAAGSKSSVIDVKSKSFQQQPVVDVVDSRSQAKAQQQQTVSVSPSAHQEPSVTSPRSSVHERVAQVNASAAAAASGHGRPLAATRLSSTMPIIESTSSNSDSSSSSYQSFKREPQPVNADIAASIAGTSVSSLRRLYDGGDGAQGQGQQQGSGSAVKRGGSTSSARASFF